MPLAAALVLLIFFQKMKNLALNEADLSVRLKSARRKKKLVKKDFEKQLLALSLEKRALYEARHNLPFILLEKPYQQGWLRYFVLRDDVLRSPNADFFQNLLDKINTYQYSSIKSFSKKTRKNGKKVWLPTTQDLYLVPMHQFHCPNLGLTNDEKTYFSVVEQWSDSFDRMRQFYKFDDSWRFVLRIKPHIITHKKVLDTDLERKIKWIENQITNKHLRPKINKLTTGRSRYKGYDAAEKSKYIDLNKNKSLQDWLSIDF